jgi:hypothetical protein
MAVAGHAIRQAKNAPAVPLDEDTIGVAVAPKRALNRYAVADGLAINRI